MGSNSFDNILAFHANRPNQLRHRPFTIVIPDPDLAGCSQGGGACRADVRFAPMSVVQTNPLASPKRTVEFSVELLKSGLHGDHFTRSCELQGCRFSGWAAALLRRYIDDVCGRISIRFSTERRRSPVSMSQRELNKWDEAHLRQAVLAAGVALWSWAVDTDRLTMDEQGYQLWGIEPRDDLRFEDLSERIHPSDRDRVREAFNATRAIVGSYETDFRILVESDVRWVSSRGQGSDADIAKRTMYGVFLDVTVRKQAEEGNELLAGEMSHRVKNLLAIAAALANITSRSTATVADMTRDLTERLQALGRAHDLVRPLPGKEGSAALLGDLLTVLLAPYNDLGAFTGRIHVSVPRMGVGEAAAQTLALVIHELATNSLKYGALSVDTGTLDVSCAPNGDQVIIVWTERGGPEVVEPTGAPGYGTQLVSRTMRLQLGGSIEYAWTSSGLIASLTINGSRLID